MSGYATLQSSLKKTRIKSTLASVICSSTGGGSGTPGGSTGQVQYNNAGAFGGFGSWDGTTFGIGTLGYSDTGINAFFQSSTNSYNQVILQNTSNGSAASTNFNVSNDQGSATTNFGEFGINSSGFSGTGSFSQPGYVYLAAASTDLVIGTYGNMPIHFTVNSGSTDAMLINASGNISIGAQTDTAKLFIQKNSLGTTQSNDNGIYIQNATAAASGLQQISPSFTLEGQGWKTNSTAASQTVAFAQYVLPVQGTANPSGTWLLRSNINGAGYSTVLSVDNIGNGIFSGQMKAATTATTAAINIVGISGNPSSTVVGDIWYETGTSVMRYKSGGSGGTVLNMMGAANNSPVASVPFATAVTNQYSFATGFTYSTTTGLAVAHGGLTVTQAAASSAWQPALTVTPGAHTSMTASTPFNGIFTKTVAATMTWAAGALASQAFNYWDAPTIAFASSSTATDVFNGYYKDPVAGTNATITNKWSLGTEGNIKIGGKPMFAGSNTTGAGSALLGTNSPAVTNTAPYTWITVITSDGSTGYIPVWK